MFQPIFNNVLIKVKHKYIGNYSNIQKAANLNPANQLNPADLVNIVGEIVALPLKIVDKPGIKGYSMKELSVGDAVIFRYDLISNYKVIDDKIQFKHLIWYRGEEVWSCSIDKIFAVIREGKIIMVNGYVKIDHPSEETKIYLPQSMKRISKALSACVQDIGENLTHLPKLDIKQGDTVYFDPGICQYYQINDKKFAIIRQQHILGVESDVYEATNLN